MEGGTIIFSLLILAIFSFQMTKLIIGYKKFKMTGQEPKDDNDAK